MTQYCGILVALCLSLVSVSSFLIPDDDIEKKSMHQPRFSQNSNRKRFENPWMNQILQTRSQKKGLYHKRNNLWTSLVKHHLVKRGEFRLLYSRQSRLNWPHNKGQERFRLVPSIFSCILFFVLTESNKVSYSECQVGSFDRMDCGYFGINSEQCASRDCCWEESVIPGVPWCFHTLSKNVHFQSKKHLGTWYLACTCGLLRVWHQIARSVFGLETRSQNVCPKRTLDSKIPSLSNIHTYTHKCMHAACNEFLLQQFAPGIIYWSVYLSRSGRTSAVTDDERRNVTNSLSVLLHIHRFPPSPIHYVDSPLGPVWFMAFNMSGRVAYIDAVQKHCRFCCFSAFCWFLYVPSILRLKVKVLSMVFCRRHESAKSGTLPIYVSHHEHHAVYRANCWTEKRRICASLLYEWHF